MRIVSGIVQKILLLALMLTTVFIVPAAYTVHADSQIITNTQGIELFVGDSIFIKSDQKSIERVFLQGNLTAANYTRTQYPTDGFAFTSTNPGTFNLRVFFNYSTGYQVNVQTSNQSTYTMPYHVPSLNPFGLVNQTATNSTTYYLSGGPSELDLSAIFVGHPYQSTSNLADSESPSTGFLHWTGNFGEAFPLWVKLLYLVLGVQFFAVGGLWINRETTKRQTSPRRFDLGDKFYLLIDIAYKFLLVSFVALGLIMGGELLIVFILRYMFLLTLNPLQLLNPFSLGFALGAVIIVYLVRFATTRGLDLKPLEDE